MVLPGSPPGGERHDGLGIVAIGRNEGERLRRCFDSLPAGLRRVVYVDSGSSDGSVAEARRRGFEVVELDLSIPFTAARARNAGLRRLGDRWPEVAFVQLVDGDCTLAPGWLESALTELRSAPRTCLVFGRRREIAPRATVYNLLADMEWDGRAGEVTACGGDALARVDALREVGGYDDRLIAGEEPELCARLRAQGWRVWRLAAEMTIHDAAMTRLEQWWRRSLRSGYGFSQVGATRPGVFDRELRSSIAWGLLLPALALLAAAFTRGWGLALLAAYPVQVARIVLRRRAGGQPLRDAWPYAVFCVLGKFPQAMGAIQHRWNDRRGHRHGLIEYK